LTNPPFLCFERLTVVLFKIQISKISQISKFQVSRVVGIGAGAITTIITLLKKLENRCAAITMLGKTVELCLQQVRSPVHSAL
jgi:hypothetical protein